MKALRSSVARGSSRSAVQWSTHCRVLVLVFLLLIPEPSKAWSGQHRKVLGRTHKNAASERIAAACRSTQSSSRFSMLSPFNETATTTLLKFDLESTLRRGADELSFVERPKPSSSFARAVEQVQALFDLASSREDEVSVSSDVVLTALDGLVSRALRNIQTATGDDVVVDLDRQLKAVEGLLGRVFELNASPSLRTIESFWMMHQYRWQLETNYDHKRASQHVEKIVNLLQNWTKWAAESGTMLSGHPPPTIFLLKVLQTASQHRVQMSTGLWDLYSSTLVQASNSRQQRDVHRHVLDLLSISGEGWKIHQCHVLQKLLRVSEDISDNSTNITTDDLSRALRASSKAGRTTDAAWLARMLIREQPYPNLSTLQTIHLLFLESLLYSNETGSLLYMERLLLTSKNVNNALTIPLNCETFKLLLRKCCLASTGSGRHAERIFFRTLRALNETAAWQPDAECVYYVVAAYLRNLSLSNIRTADLFVRQCVKQLRLLPSQLNATPVDNKRRTSAWRIFDRLLEAYGASASFNTSDESKAIQRADELFRFFLVQYRMGHILTEEPNEHHLEHMVGLWNRSASLTGKSCQQRITEYRQLIRSFTRDVVKDMCRL